MTTSSTNTWCDQSSNANFQTWVNEVYTNLVTNCGLTQTSDTGQMAVPCTTNAPIAGATTAGYYIFRFNDTLQATSPVFIKMEFGSGGSGANYPQLVITVGTGSNGSGTINGTVMTRTPTTVGNTAGQTTTNYTSRFCYNATQGFLGMSFKQGQCTSHANAPLFGFAIYRSVDNTGAPTGDAVHLLTNYAVSGYTGISNSGYCQIINYNTSTAYNSSGPIGNATYWMFAPFLPNFTIEGTTGQLLPVFQWKGSATVPGFGITNQLAVCLLSEIAINATVTVTILGSTSLTYICVGALPSTSSIGPASLFTSATYGVLMLWQ